MIKVEETLDIYPPRPYGSVPPQDVDRYNGFWAQYKYNDIRVLISILPSGKIRMLSRKKVPLLSFELDSELKHSINRLALEKGFFHLLDGGVMRTGVGATKKKSIIIWDILVYENRYLLGTTYKDRYRLLKKVAGNPSHLETETGHKIGLEIGPRLWLPKIYKEKFSRIFEKTKKLTELEGLVLKNPLGKLQWGTSEENNGDWQVRVLKTWLGAPK